MIRANSEQAAQSVRIACMRSTPLEANDACVTKSFGRGMYLRPNGKAKLDDV